VAAVLIAFGLCVAFGWAECIASLRRLVPGDAATEGSTAVDLILTGVSVFLLSASDKRLRIVGRIVSFLMFAAALLMFVESVSGRDFGTVITLFSADPSSAGLSYPGPMAAVSAVAFIFIGASLFLCDVRPRDKFYCNEALAAGGLAIALTTLIGNACGANKLCTPAGCIITPIATSTSFVLASLSVLLLRPKYGVVSFIVADTLAGKLMRRALGGIIILPFLLWLRGLGEKAGLYEPALGWALFFVTSIIVIGIAVFFAVRDVVARLERSDQEKHLKLVDSSKRETQKDAELSELKRQISVSQENKEKRLKHVCVTCAKEFDLDVKKCPTCGGGLARITRKHFIGETFAGKYELKEFLGEGGMSAVYKAQNLAVRKPVAIKVIHSSQSSDPQSIRRLQQEARAAGVLDHPNLVHVYDFGITEEGEAYLIMELLDGQSLSQILAGQKRLSNKQVTSMFAEICTGLEYAHQKGIVHRDLKPSNVMLVRESNHLRVKIVDFGIARDLNVGESQRLTTTGQLIGSPPYMSPEQCSGLPLDARSDIYSLGCMLYECIAGRTPFTASNVIALICMHLDAEPAPFDPELQVPEKWKTIVFTCLKKDPHHRFQTMKEVRLELLADPIKT